jgi:hypothetical protein
MLYSPLKIYWHFQGILSPHLQGQAISLSLAFTLVSRSAYSLTLKMEQTFYSKSRLAFNRLHDVIPQKIEIFITTIVRTSNPGIMTWSVLIYLQLPWTVSLSGTVTSWNLLTFLYNHFSHRNHLAPMRNSCIAFQHGLWSLITKVKYCSNSNVSLRIYAWVITLCTGSLHLQCSIIYWGHT